MVPELLGLSTGVELRSKCVAGHESQVPHCGGSRLQSGQGGWLRWTLCRIDVDVDSVSA